MIFYVEDEVSLNKVYTRALELKGYKCMSFTDPEAALDLFPHNEREVNLVITDIMLPKINGVELSRRVKAKGYTGPVLAITGLIDTNLPEWRWFDMTKAKEIGGFVDIILKPLTLDDLISAVSRWYRKPNEVTQ